ncbi:MAG: hypothetical protein BGN99_28010 [Alphaproteobacteria bacterium 65-37]|jgi:hypothetical protein|nr:hypothetical protein [Alphaproteobacteria bacterium]OJU33948.1 MAG: hypothetical protein BGN99_28010 [Alphaproteobacteria bacterium 65-37]
MSIFRFSSLLTMAALALGACSNPDPEAPTTPAVAMPGIDYAVANSTPGEAERAMSHKTWLWTRGPGPAQIHYTTADGRDFVWLVGERRIFKGEWKTQSTTESGTGSLIQVCLRYPGVNVGGLSSNWTCRPAGTFFVEMQQRESGDPLRIAGRTQALFVLTQPPANLAEVEGRVAAIQGIRN